MSKNEYFWTIKSEKEPDKEVSVAVVFNNNYQLPERMEEHLKREIAELAAWVHRNMKEKE